MNCQKKSEHAKEVFRCFRSGEKSVRVGICICEINLPVIYYLWGNDISERNKGKNAMDWGRIFLVFTDILLPLAAGYFLKVHTLMPRRFCDWLIRFNVIVMVTVLTLMSFWVLPLSAQLLWLPLIGVLITAVPGLIGAKLFAGGFDNDLDRGAYVISAMLSNIGTIGGLCAFIMYGETGFAYVQLVAAPQNILMVAAAFPMAKYYYEKNKAAENKAKLQLSFREMFITWNQMGILGMAAGIALQMCGIERPPVLGALFHNLVHILAWISLLPVGYLIDFSRAGQYYSRVTSMLWLRFVIVPVIFYAGFRLLFTDQILLGSLLIMAATPAAINSVITAQLYKLNVDLTIASFILTTVVFVLVVFPVFFFYIHLGGRL